MNDNKLEKQSFVTGSQKSKTIEINGKEILVDQLPLDMSTYTIVVNTLCDIFSNEYITYGKIIDKEWTIRMSTLYLYTNVVDVFNLDSKKKDTKTREETDAELERFHEIMYGTPLYAMIVGTPQDPKYFEGHAYTSPLIDIDQYNGILRAVDDTFESRLYLWKESQKNEND